ncbi:hypothetical protein N7509_005835 [Penicillium cosmopolitanum]|uniref:Uncharacterized protein n=1 Tax=Penicillium cosmopolitanum TaxID=1131564 RepID=A0A9W9W370_9EURO|nr:uncharacterized protein N7509_005835 [Penicillium cosmopolitanum]KAJ5397722.1 hypothetical protein N7509_005835 [Penicillium cosmopolitanum]
MQTPQNSNKTKKRLSLGNRTPVSRAYQYQGRCDSRVTARPLGWLTKTAARFGSINHAMYCKGKEKCISKKKLSLGESNPGLPRLSVLMTSGNHDH